VKTLHIVPYFSPAWAYGGIPRIVIGLVGALARRWPEVWVLTTEAGSEGRGEPSGGKGGNYRVVVLPNLSNYLADRFQFFLPRGTHEFFRKRIADFDLVHIHGCHHLLGVFAYSFLQRERIPYVISPYGTAPRIERHQAAKWVFDRLFWDRVFFQARHYHALSRLEKDQLQDLGISPEKISVIYPGVNLEEFSEIPPRGEFRRRYRIPETDKVILYLGRISPRKGIEHLLQAFGAIGGNGFRLVIAGNDWGYQAFLERLARQQGISGRIVFTGLLSGKERLSAYVDADLLVYPSTLEAFGLVPVEALLCGTPVIITRQSGCAEILGKIGDVPIIEYGDVPGLKKCILGNLGKKVPESAKDFLRRELDWANLAEEMTGLYARAGRENAPRPGSG